MKRVLCYGDSNTWGYISGSDHLRYDENSRWTKLLNKLMGGEIEVIEEGLNSRTICSDDIRPGKEGRNGLNYLKPCLDSHDKIDFIILMLGTNELKYTFNNTATDIFNSLLKMIKLIQTNQSQIDKSVPTLIICGIPPINEDTEYSRKDNKYLNAHKKCLEFNLLLWDYCKENGIIYVNNNDLTVGVDGVHLTKESHSKLAERLSKVIKHLL